VIDVRSSTANANVAGGSHTVVTTIDVATVGSRRATPGTRNAIDVSCHTTTSASRSASPVGRCAWTLTEQPGGGAPAVSLSPK
jgi:hypothetical protein